jgi:NhaP-type Na+/H+ or K+/H+ antiporter
MRPSRGITAPWLLLASTVAGTLGHSASISLHTYTLNFFDRPFSLLVGWLGGYAVCFAVLSLSSRLKIARPFDRTTSMLLVLSIAWAIFWYANTMFTIGIPSSSVFTHLLFTFGIVLLLNWMAIRRFFARVCYALLALSVVSLGCDTQSLPK